jgi:hypothetical protein
MWFAKLLAVIVKVLFREAKREEKLFLQLFSHPHM